MQLKERFNVCGIAPSTRRALLVGLVSVAALLTGTFQNEAHAQNNTGYSQTQKPWANDPSYIARQRQIDTYAATYIPQANSTYNYQMQTCATNLSRERAANSKYESRQQGGGVLGDINRAMDKFNTRYGQPNANYNLCVDRATQARDYAHNYIAQQYDSLDASFAQQYQYKIQAQQSQAAAQAQAQQQRAGQLDAQKRQMCETAATTAYRDGINGKGTGYLPNNHVCVRDGYVAPAPR